MPSEGIKHKILLILIAITIIGEVSKIMRPDKSLPEFSDTILDVQLGILNAAIFIPLNIIALLGILKRKNWAPLFFIAISIVNRLLSQLLFDGGIHMIFVTWTFILVVFAYNEYRGLSNFETAFLSVGVISDLALSSFLFYPADTQTLIYGLTFYWLFLAILVGTAIAIRKFR